MEKSNKTRHWKLMRVQLEKPKKVLMKVVSPSSENIALIPQEAALSGGIYCCLGRAQTLHCRCL